MIYEVQARQVPGTWITVRHIRAREAAHEFADRRTVHKGDMAKVYFGDLRGFGDDVQDVV
mgnify:CR=1 FL=1